jgi:hypothetical protein
MESMKIAAVPPVQNQARLVEQALTAPLPPAPPELVSRFEALMARAPSPEQGRLTEAPQMKAAVAGAEGHLKQHLEVLDRVSAAVDGNIDPAELVAVQMRTMLDLAALSITQSAYANVVTSTKGAVSDLMKSQ